MIFYTSGIRGMIAIEEKVAIPSSDGVLEVVRERSVGVLTEVLLKDMNSGSFHFIMTWYGTHTNRASPHVAFHPSSECVL